MRHEQSTPFSDREGMSDNEAGDEDATPPGDAPSPRVVFDVLVHSRASAAELLPSLETIEEFRPPAEWIERCRLWLSDQQVTCHRTDFGLACEASPEVFEELFSARLAPGEGPEGGWRVESDIEIPEPIADIVEQVTVPPAPEWL